MGCVCSWMMASGAKLGCYVSKHKLSHKLQRSTKEECFSLAFCCESVSITLQLAGLSQRF